MERNEGRMKVIVQSLNFGRRQYIIASLCNQVVVHSYLVAFQLFPCDFLGVTSDLRMAAPINRFSESSGPDQDEGSLLQRRSGHSIVSGGEENSSRCR